MIYIAADESADGVAKVIYGSKDAKTTKSFKALGLWLLKRSPPPKPMWHIRRGGPRRKPCASITWILRFLLLMII